MKAMNTAADPDNVSSTIQYLDGRKAFLVNIGGFEFMEAEIALRAKPSEPDGETNTRREASDCQSDMILTAGPSGSLPVFFESLMDLFVVYFYSQRRVCMHFTTQMDAAKLGIITPQMTAAAAKENMDADKLRQLIVQGLAVLPANKKHASLDPQAIGQGLWSGWKKCRPVQNNMTVRMKIHTGSQFTFRIRCV